MPQQRMPILLWGDLVRGKTPVLRRALAGAAAHECMYAWVYLTEYLALRRLQGAVNTAPPAADAALFGAFDETIWTFLDRRAIDPHFQLVKEGFHLSACVTAAAAALGGSVRIAELGSTFFASRVKFQILSALASRRIADWPVLAPEWIGLDNSSFMRDVSQTLHQDAAPVILDDYAKFQGDERAIFLARFVASYAFPSSEEFAEFLVRNFGAVILEDAFSASAVEVPVENHGQPEVFFSLPIVLKSLRAAGFTFYKLSSYPDYPARTSPCHVIKFLAVRPTFDMERVKQALNILGFPFDPVKQAVGETLLEQLNSEVSPERWKQVEWAKARSPVWGPTAETVKLPGILDRARGYIEWRSAKNPWRHYRLSGPMAMDAIRRAGDVGS